MSWLLPAAALFLIFAGRRKDEREADAQDVEIEKRRIVEQAKSELSPLEATALREVVDAPGAPVKAPKPRARRRPKRPAKRTSTTRASKSTDEDALIRQAAEAALAAERAAEKDDVRASVPSDPATTRPAPAPAQPRAPARVTKKPLPAPEPVLVIPEAKPVLPEGYDPAAARRQAQSAANHIRKREYDYSRKLLRDWQVLAGLKPDGVYGPQTRSALKYFGATKVPSPLFRRRKDKSIIRDSDPDAQYIPPEAR